MKSFFFSHFQGSGRIPSEGIYQQNPITHIRATVAIPPAQEDTWYRGVARASTTHPIAPTANRRGSAILLRWRGGGNSSAAIGSIQSIACSGSVLLNASDCVRSRLI